MNFFLCTALYILISHRVFNVTNNIKFLMLPLKDNKALLYNFGIMTGLLTICYIVALVLHATVWV